MKLLDVPIQYFFVFLTFVLKFRLKNKVIHYLLINMKIRYINFLFVFFLLFFNKLIYAQDFYQTNWTQDGVKYSGLLIYYEESDAIMRVQFSYQNEAYVAEYKCKGEYFDEPNYSGYLLDGFSAKMVRGNLSLSYIPDNFIFIKKGESYGTPYVIDDNQLNNENYDNLIQVNYWEKVESTVFTSKLVQQFFDSEEPLYQTLLSLNSPQSLGAYRISAQGYGQGLWAIAMSKGTDLTTQIWKTAYDFPEDWISEKWNSEMDITELAYGQDLWSVSMSKGTGYGRQSWRKNTYIETDWIKTKWSEGYAITSIAYGKTDWVMVMSEKTSYTYQYIERTTDFPKDWISEKWSEGFSITSIAYGGGKWAVVVSKGANLGLQTWKTAYDYPREWIATKWNKGYYITSVTYGQGLWCVIMSKRSDFTTQIWKTSVDFPKSWIADKWNKKQNNTVVNDNHTNNNNQVHYTNVKMHLIIVANTKVPDIGQSCLVDQQRIENEFDVICNELNIDINKVIINDLNLKKENVTHAIDNLNPSPNDIVVFIYSGHGFRWSNEVSRYPRISLKFSSYQSISNANSYNLEDIYRKIVNKGARLNLVFGDCCNSNVGVTSRGGNGGNLGSRSQMQGKVSRLKKLFIDADGDILVAAAEPNQIACGSQQNGGYFTTSFFQSLNKETSYLSGAQLPSWDNIIKNTLNSAAYKTQNLNGCSKQNGIFKSSVR